VLSNGLLVDDDVIYCMTRPRPRGQVVPLDGMMASSGRTTRHVQRRAEHALMPTRGWDTCHCQGIAICGWLAPVVQPLWRYPLIRFTNVSASPKETTMSQHAHKNRAHKHTSISEQKRQEPPITGVSPDDPIGVIPEETGKKPAPHK
jgi:hypothetical protein